MALLCADETGSHTAFACGICASACASACACDCAAMPRNPARMTLMMKIVIDNGRRRLEQTAAGSQRRELSDFHANDHEMESARLPGPRDVDLSATNVLEPQNERHFNASRH